MLVPPMSKLTASANPHAAAISAAARTPPAGPESSSDAGSPRAAGRRARGRRPTSSPALRSPRSRAASDSGVQTGSRNASTTVVTMRSYSRNSGLTSCEHTTSSDRAARSASPTARSWRGSRSACSRQTAIASTASAIVGQRAVERLDLRALRVEPAGDLEPHVARHERRRPVDERVVQRRPHLARDLDLVDEAARRDQRDARAPPFEQRVGGHRRAVREHVDRVSAADGVDRALDRARPDRRASTRPWRPGRRRRRRR